MGIEGLHTETGAGVLEAALRVDDGLGRDRQGSPVQASSPRCWRRSRGWLATFMAKWSKDWPGCGGHMHMSLWDKKKRQARSSFDEKAPHRMSEDDAPVRRRPGRR